MSDTPENAPPSEPGNTSHTIVARREESEGHDAYFLLFHDRRGAKTEDKVVAPRKPERALWIRSALALLVITVTAALFLIYKNHRLLVGVIWGLLSAISVIWLLPKWQVSRVSVKNGSELFAIENEARKSVAQAITGLAFLLTFYSTIENIKSTQQSAEQTRELTRSAQINDQFTKALERLAKKDSVESNILGSYTLAEIALNSPERSTDVLEVLTAYLRVNSPWPRAKMAGGSDESENTELPPAIEAAITQLRQISVQGALSDSEERAVHYREALSDLNLSKTDLHGANLTSVWLVGADLQGTNLSGARLDSANLKAALLIKAELPAVDLTSTDLSSAILNGANLRGASFSEKTGLTQVQIESACFDEDDTPPPGLKLPATVSSECVQMQHSERPIMKANSVKEKQ